MKKSICALALMSALALTACGKKAADDVAPPAASKPPPETVVSAEAPAFTEEQKQNMRTAFVKFVSKANKGKGALASNWDDAIAAKEQKVEYVHCWAEDDEDADDDAEEVDDEYCHLYTEQYVPLRWIRIVDKGDGGFVAYIRSDQNSKEFMFCDNLQVFEKLGASYIDGECTFRPHDEQGLHYAIFNALYSTKSKKFDNIYFAYLDKHPDGSGGTEVHNGDAHGGDD